MADGRKRSKLRRGGGHGRQVDAFAIGRRDFMKMATLAAASSQAGCEPEELGSLSHELHIDSDLAIDFSIEAKRKQDFVLLRFDFVNFAPNSERKLLKRLRTGNAFVIVNFPPQHVVEEAFFEPGDDGDLPEAGDAIQSRIAGPSRVAFVIPATTTEIPFSLDGLLGLVGQLEMHVALNALPPGEREAVVTTNSVTQLASVPKNAKRRSRSAGLLYRQRQAYAQQYWSEPTAQAVTALESEVAGAPSKPFNHETAIELPFRLQLSPNRFGAWAHSAQPVASPSGRVELWHTRLGTRADDYDVDERDPTLRKVRAIWTRDPGFLDVDLTDSAALATFNDQASIFDLEALNPSDRAAIVALSSNFERYTDGELPKPVDVNQLMLTALGGWLDVRGDWPTTDISVEQWEHRATLGRDHYVKVVFKGVIYPYGHRASCVVVTERKLKHEEGAPDNHEHSALLRKRLFILIREPDKDYTSGRELVSTDPDNLDAGNHLRKLPFDVIKVRTLVTPNLDQANLDAVVSLTPFVPSVDGNPLAFRFEAKDLEGSIVRFSGPVVWVPVTGAGATAPTSARLDTAKAAYDGLEALKRLNLGGQRLAFAPSAKPDDAAFETHSITFTSTHDATAPVAVPEAYPGFVPVIELAEVELTALRAVAGKERERDSSDLLESRTYTYHDQYVTHGFPQSDGDGNQGELLLRLTTPLNEVEPKFGFQDNADRSGGFLKSGGKLIGVSRRIGPVSGGNASPGEDSDSDVAAGTFNPLQFFEGVPEIRLFGVLDLRDILAAGDVGLDQAPKMISQVVSAALGLISDVEGLFEDLKAAGYAAVDNAGLLGDTGLIQALFERIEQIIADPSAVSGLADDVEALAEALAGVPARLDALRASTISDPDGLSRGLRDVLAGRAAALASSLPVSVPALIEQLTDLVHAAELPKELRANMEWRAKLTAWPEDEPIFKPNRPDGLLLSVDIRALTDGSSDPQVDLSCTIEDFDLNVLAPLTFLTVKFDFLTFRVKNGKKPEVQLAFKPDGFVFQGPLAFINALQRLIPLDGFSDPPKVDVDGTGIRAGFSVALPNIAVGIFSLENINLGAELRIPFIGVGSSSALSLRFDFSTRENPFNLSVALLGGGGFFGLTATAEGLLLLEAALEAGARISINLGVASGSVSAMLGIYFRMESGVSEDTVELTGYFRLRGEVDVLGLVSVSVQLALSLTYNFDTHKVTGRATLEIEIEICFFSASVTIECERQFAGSNGDPTFQQIMAPEGDFRPWETYLEAFAA